MTSFRPVHAFAATCLLCLLSACGGGDGSTDAAADPSSTTPDALVASCNTKGYVAGSVVAPSVAELAVYAGTYQGVEGDYNDAGEFVESGDATLVIAADGSVTYQGTGQTVTSICMDKVAGTYGQLLYLIVGDGHIDVSEKVQADLGQAWGVSPSDGSTIFTLGVKS